MFIFVGLLALLYYEESMSDIPTVHDGYTKKFFLHAAFILPAICHADYLDVIKRVKYNNEPFTLGKPKVSHQREPLSCSVKHSLSHQHLLKYVT